MMGKCFVWRGIFAGGPWRVVHREAEAIDNITGQPLTWRLVAEPGGYATAQEAQMAADRLSAVFQGDQEAI